MELAFIFDLTTKELLGSTQYFNRDEQGNPELPSNYTMTIPDEDMEGYAQIFNGTSWSYVIDKRGTQYWLPTDEWNSPARIMRELGELPESARLTPPDKPQSVIIEEEVIRLKAYLNSTDYIYAKCAETGEDVTVLYADVIAERKKARLRIQELENV